MAELSVRNLTCTYGNHIALNNITARFPTGKITALIGSNGSGKSTLLETLAGMLAPRSGSINNLVPEIAFVPQRSHVSHNLPITIRQTVSMGRWSAKKNWQRLTAADCNIVDSCLDRLEISGLADRPLGEVSGGQRQRALIAQGLAQQAPLLLLDEPLMPWTPTRQVLSKMSLTNNATKEPQLFLRLTILIKHIKQIRLSPWKKES